jgi:hypothetical protein
VSIAKWREIGITGRKLNIPTATPGELMAKTPKFNIKP